MTEREYYFERMMLSYGIVTLVAAEKTFQLTQEFENCAAIKNVIEKLTKRHPDILIAQISPNNSFEKLQHVFQESFYDYNLSGQVAEKNFHHYIETVINGAPK